MGVGEVDGPPKKKLKQARLSFCLNSAEKSTGKRKLTSDSPESGLALKVSRKEGTPRVLGFNKENVKVNNVETVSEVVNLLSDNENDVLLTTDNANDEVKGVGEKVPAAIKDAKEDELELNSKTSHEINIRPEEDSKIIESDLQEHVDEEALSTTSKASNNESLLQKGDSVVLTEAVESSKNETAVKTSENNALKEPLESNETEVENGENCNAPNKDVESEKEAVVDKDESKSLKDGVEVMDTTIVENCEIDTLQEAKTCLEVGSQLASQDSEKLKAESSNQEDEKVQVKIYDKNDELAKNKEQGPLVAELNDSVEALDSSLVESKLNLSIESDQGGPNSSFVISSEEELDTSSLSSKKLNVSTSKMSKAERARHREEKMKLKKEKEELRKKKREEREEQKKKKNEVREEEKRKKEEEQKKKEEEKKRREEERKKKEEERKKKDEEKKKKEESKEEDRRKKEEARLAEERKENLAKMAFTKFFIQPKSKSSGPKKEEVEEPVENPEEPKFMPFPVKADMRLAAQVRHFISEEDKKSLSDALESSFFADQLYLDELKKGLRIPCTRPATWPLSEEQHDVIIVESVIEEKSDHEDEVAMQLKTKRQKAKLLQFHDNRRPPYWGTWRKTSASITPRKPFGMDKVFDYEVDSDSEWEDEEEGEDIDKEGESDKEQSDDEEVGEDGYLLDNTFVPHGYLSDEEAAEEEENLNPEDQKLKLKVLKQEFEQELKAKNRLKPRLLGCVWISNETTEVSKGSLYETLMNLRCGWDEKEGPIDPTGPAIVDCTPTISPVTPKFPTTLTEQLVKLVHGSRLSLINLVGEFMNVLDQDKQLSSVSKRVVSLKIKEIAQKTRKGNGSVWTVSPELCSQYNLPSLEPISVPPSHVSPVPESSIPKPKETALVSFLKKASTPPGSKRRVTPTLISPLVRGSGSTSTVSSSAGVTHSPSSLAVTEPEAASSSSSITIDAPPTQPTTIVDPQLANSTHSTTKPTNCSTPPVRKKIQPITLSRTVSSAMKTPSTPKVAPIFMNPKRDTPRPPPNIRQAPIEIDLCDDSN